MKARIEKKLSKRLVELFPALFRKAWRDEEPSELAYKQRTSVRHVLSVGGGTNYWGEGEDAYTVWAAWIGHSEWSWPWHGAFPDYPEDHELHGYPDVSAFKPTTRNLLKLAAQCQLAAEADKRTKQCA